jgi:hypothetical protein
MATPSSDHTQWPPRFQRLSLLQGLPLLQARQAFPHLKSPPELQPTLLMCKWRQQWLKLLSQLSQVSNPSLQLRLRLNSSLRSRLSHTHWSQVSHAAAKATEMESPNNSSSPSSFRMSRVDALRHSLYAQTQSHPFLSHKLSALLTHSIEWKWLPKGLISYEQTFQGLAL